MATLLYEELGVQATATVEEIKKAYRKRALQTHPDRLPPTSSEQEKKDAEEKFRKVNHAYEVLTDPGKRRDYDAHGVWPPPVDEIPRASTNNGGFNTHFDSFGGFPHRHHHHHHQQFPTFVFQDPFALFNSIFADMTGSGSRFGPGPAFFDDQFERFERLDREFERKDREMNARFDADPMADSFPAFGGFGGGGFSSHFGMHPEPPRRGSGRSRGSGKWMSESYMTQSINGVTQSVVKRRDWEGNEHVTRTFPDGREVYTINGVDQASQGNLPSSTERRQISAPSQEPQRMPFVATSSVPSQAYSSTSHGGNQGFYYKASPSSSHSYHSTTVHTHGTPQPRTYTVPANPQVTQRDQPRKSRDGESLHEHSDNQHQNHLHGTHRKSRSPYHPNPAPYYLDDVDRNPYHSKHRRRRRPWDKC